MKKLGEKLILILTLLFAFSCASFPNFRSMNNAQTVASDLEFSIANDIKGEYFINLRNDISTYLMINGDYDRGDGYEKPTIIKSNAYTGKDYHDTKSYFSIYPIKGVTKNGYQAYYISSPADAASRLDVKNADFENGNLWFFKEKAIEPTVTNVCQQVYIERSTDYSNVYRFFYYSSEADYKYYVSAKETTLKIIREDKLGDDGNRYIEFVLFDVDSKRSIGSSLNISNGPNRYDVNSLKEVYRTVENADNNVGAPKFSKPFTFGIREGYDLVDEYMDSSFRKHFVIPFYSNNLAINASFVYQSWYADFKDFHWEKDMSLQAREDTRTRYLDTMSNFLGQGDSNGSFVIQKYSNNKRENIYIAPYIDGTFITSLKPNRAEYMSTKEEIFRVYFAYTIRNTRKETRDIILLSDEFFLRFGGIEKNSSFLPILVSPLDDEIDIERNNEQETLSQANYHSTFNGRDFYALLPGSLVREGFKVEPLINGTEVHVFSKEADVYTTIKYPNKAEFNEPGNYELTVRNSTYPGEYFKGEIYVSGEEVSKYLLGSIFAKRYKKYNKEDPYFINGTRVAVGYGEELENENSVGLYPTYLNEVEVRSTPNLLKATELKIDVYINDELFNSYDSNVYISGAKYSKPGEYHIHIEANFNKRSGICCVFDIKFNIGNDFVHGTVNDYLINNATHEFYDIKPVVYAVRAEYGPLFKDDVHLKYYDSDNNVKSKLASKYVVFNTHEEALYYAIAKLKNTLFYDNGVYRYYEGQKYENGSWVDNWLFFTEYQAYKFIAEKAENLIERIYLTYDDAKGMIDYGRYYIYPTEKDVPKRLFVTSNKDSLENLTYRELINNYEFITDDEFMISSNISLYDENNRLIDDNFPYFVKVEDYMREHSLPSGKYIFVDTAPGLKSTIVRNYIEPASDRHNHIDAVTKISGIKLGEKFDITHENLNRSYGVKNGFKIDDISNKYDSYCLVIVTSPKGEEEFFSINDIPNNTYEEVGTYIVKVSDRVGNFYSIYVNVRNE